MTIEITSPAHSIIDHQIKALFALKESITAQSLVYRNIMSVLKGAAESNYSRRIVITGVGKNANLATKASETFASLGIPSLYLNTCHYSHGDAGFIGHNDVVVHISRSGKTEEMQGMARHLSKIRPNVVQILLHCNETLAHDMRDPFHYIFCAREVTEADEHSLAPTTSTTVLLALLDTFGIQLSSHIGFERTDFLAYHPGGSLGQMLRSEK